VKYVQRLVSPFLPAAMLVDLHVTVLVPGWRNGNFGTAKCGPSCKSPINSCTFPFHIISIVPFSKHDFCDRDWRLVQHCDRNCSKCALSEMSEIRRTSSLLKQVKPDVKRVAARIRTFQLYCVIISVHQLHCAIIFMRTVAHTINSLLRKILFMFSCTEHK